MAQNKQQDAPSMAEFKKWLAYHIAKNRQHLAEAPVAFLSVFLLSIIVAWFFIWQVVVPLKNEQIAAKQGIIDQKQAIIEGFKERQTALETAMKSSPSGSVQMLIYTNDPNAEKLTPGNTNGPAFAYPDGGDKPTFTWSIKRQRWM